MWERSPSVLAKLSRCLSDCQEAFFLTYLGLSSRGILVKVVFITFIPLIVYGQLLVYSSGQAATHQVIRLVPSVAPRLYMIKEL